MGPKESTASPAEGNCDKYEARKSEVNGATIVSNRDRIQ